MGSVAKPKQPGFPAKTEIDNRFCASQVSSEVFSDVFSRHKMRCFYIFNASAGAEPVITLMHWALRPTCLSTPIFEKSQKLHLSLKQNRIFFVENPAQASYSTSCTCLLEAKARNLIQFPEVHQRGVVCRYTFEASDTSPA